MPNFQKIKLVDFPSSGYILDIGGGGEGIIARLKARNVISIDPKADELYEAKGESLKIVMDACDLKFLDNTFSFATSFFTLMYIQRDNRIKVFREIKRVLKPGGIFYIWDAKIDSQNVKNKQDIFTIGLDIAMPAGDHIKTGYGVRMKNHEQNIGDHKALAVKAGFSIEKELLFERHFFLKLKCIKGFL